jgi:long-chain acyl-CoA synthetase
MERLPNMLNFRPEEFDFQGIVYENMHISCGDFKKAIFYLSEKILKNIRQNRSPFIYLVAENHPKTIIAYFAILKANFSCVLIDPDWKTLEWEYIISDTPPSAIIRIDHETSFSDFQKDIEFLPEKPDASFEEKRGYTIVYTAAEDGFAKGAMLSQHNILSDALAMTKIVNANRDSVICPLLPFSHLFGLTTGCISPIYSNSTIAIVNIRNISQISAISKHLSYVNTTHLWTVPIIIYLIGNLPSTSNAFKTVKYISSGGYKLPSILFDSILKKYNIQIQEGYGLTEAAPVCTWHHIGEKIIVDSVGKPFSCCDVQIFDDNNCELPAHAIGEVCIKGENVMEGYYKKENRNVITNKWLHTGDLGKIDTCGYLYLTGLKKNMANVGGRKVYPKEVERMLRVHDNVLDVIITSSEHQLTGSKISAKISLKISNTENQQSFMKWCIKNIAAYKLPKQWEFA